ncbi:DUF475 domain-containing protein [Nocardia sp. XZ_19_385]|uniref:DUF475 domain-containing protein n=1 Tax=Nocardia sp. XZ_19_385 TaxID=2769488 RepID=UPI001890B476|nr:DUF475 domain-containing protein [Nocardia sp. XZ_19_385]
MVLRIYGLSIAVTVVSLIAAFLYGGVEAFLLCAILGILEVSLSFDNAVINATILERMSEFWQKIFLTIGVVIAVFGMRLVFPLAIVWVTAGLTPVKAFDLAMNVPSAEEQAAGVKSYETLLTEAHPSIAAFGGMFLLMLFLNFIFDEREITWLSWLEKPLAKVGKLDMVSVVVAGIALILTAEFLTADKDRSTVLLAGLLGMVVYIAVDGLGSLFHTEQLVEEHEHSGPSTLVKATGKAAFFLFLYLEVLDASFSFDGVIGAFAITSDPIIIALGLGLIGAMFVRSITVYLVRKGTLGEYVYLEHGAHWAIGALAVILFISIKVHVPELVTGLIGIALIGAAFVTSIIRNKRNGGDDAPEVELEKSATPVG